MVQITIILGLYFATLLILGVVFSKNNRNADDFIRSGAKAEWWLVGGSVFVSGISAFTFTGNASAAYNAGPTLLAIYLANIAAFLIGGVCFAPWCRQTRAVNIPDIVKARYGLGPEQFGVYLGAILGPFTAAVQLWALAVFIHSVFDLPVIGVILVVGFVVTMYSLTGGRWAVMVTDFVQGMLLFAITLVVTYLSLKAMGGLGAFFDYFSDPRFASDFRLIKDPGDFDQNRFTLKWAAMAFAMQLFFQLSIANADRFLTVKDSREAKKSSFFAMALMIIGSSIWFIPPMVARFLYEEQIMQAGYDNAAEASYAFIALELMPTGLVGILVAGMFAATMSSMDTGLAAVSGTIVRNMIPALRRAFKWSVLPEKREVFYCRLFTFVIGLVVIGYAILLETQDQFILFDAFLFLSSAIGVPLGFPLLAGIWIRRLPSWSYFIIAGCGLLASIYTIVDQYAFDNPWTIQDRGLLVIAVGVLITACCRLGYARSSAKEKAHLAAFYERMDRPVDFEKEIGEGDHGAQRIIIGKAGFVIGLLLMFLLFTAESLSDVLAISFVSLFVLTIGAVLWASGLRIKNAAKARPHEAEA